MRLRSSVEAVDIAAALNVLEVERDRVNGATGERGEASGDDRALTCALDVLSEALRDGVRPALGEHGSRAETLAFFVKVGSTDFEATRFGRSPVYCAAECGNAAALELLIEAGCDVNAADTFLGESPAGVAAQIGHAVVLELLIKAGCDVNAANGLRLTPAHLAAERGRTGALELLIEAGCDVNAASGDGNTPAHAAASRGHAAALELLIKAGCDVNAGDGYGNTPAHKAANQGQAAALELLIKAGCDVNAANICGWTPAVHACMAGSDFDTAGQGHAAALTLLIKAGYDFHRALRCYQRRFSGFEKSRLLEIAAQGGHLGCVRVLTRAGANLVEEGELLEDVDC